MRTVKKLWTDDRAEGTSGGSLVAVVLLVIALIFVVIYFMGGFGTGGDDADIEVDLNTDRDPTSMLPDSGAPTNPSSWRVHYVA